MKFKSINLDAESSLLTLEKIQKAINQSLEFKELEEMKIFIHASYYPFMKKEGYDLNRFIFVGPIDE